MEGEPGLGEGEEDGVADGVSAEEELGGAFDREDE